MAIKSKEKTARELKEFGFVMALVLLIMTLLLLRKDNHWALFTFAISALFIVSSIFTPQSLRKIESIWTKLGMSIGFVMTHVILTILFIVVITPLAVILRLFGKQFLDLKTDPQANSYWIEVNKDGPSSRHYLPY